MSTTAAVTATTVATFEAAATWVAAATWAATTWVATAKRLVKVLAVLASNDDVSIEEAFEWGGLRCESDESDLFEREFESAECRLAAVEWTYDEIYAEMEAHLHCKLAFVASMTRRVA